MCPSRFVLSALTLTLAFGLVSADEPYAFTLGRPTLETGSYNQQQAQAIAAQIRASGQLRSYRVEVSYADGLAELDGFVGDAYQAQEAVRLAQSVPGVSRVQNRLKVIGGMAPAQFVAGSDEETAPPPRPLAPPGDKEQTVVPQDPLPSFRAPIPAYAVEALPPPMPPHAWPTYAPYNNFSRVAYPTSYPYEAFPHIGPVYPFPKAPLGWRSVKLEFDDGHWWLSSHAQRRDWWFLRYW